MRHISHHLAGKNDLEAELLIDEYCDYSLDPKSHFITCYLVR